MDQPNLQLLYHTSLLCLLVQPCNITSIKFRTDHYHNVCNIKLILVAKITSRHWWRLQVSNHGKLPCLQLGMICKTPPLPASINIYTLSLNHLRLKEIKKNKRKVTYLINVTHYNFVYSLVPEKFPCSRPFSSTHNENIFWPTKWN